YTAMKTAFVSSLLILCLSMTDSQPPGLGQPPGLVPPPGLPCFNLMLVFDVSCEWDDTAFVNAVNFSVGLIKKIMSVSRHPENAPLKVGVIAFDKRVKLYLGMEPYEAYIAGLYKLIKQIMSTKRKCKTKTDIALRSLYENHMEIESTKVCGKRAMAAILFTDGLTDSKSVKNIDNVLNDVVLFHIDLFTVQINMSRKNEKVLHSIIPKLQISNAKRYFDIKGPVANKKYNFRAKRFFDIRNKSTMEDIVAEFKREQPFPPNMVYHLGAPDLGFESEPHCWPWFAAIQRRDKFHPMGWVNFCGGSLLNDGWVLTAAHCFKRKKEEDLRIVLGKHDLTKIEEGEAAYNISMIKAHGRNDIALVKLDGIPDIKFRRIKPAKLPDRKAKKALLDYVNNHGRFSVIGFGVITKSTWGRQSEVLREISLKSQPLDQCKKTYDDKDTRRLFSVRERVTADTICAGGLRFDACKGDSGGPLMSNMTGEWLVYGLVRSGPPE
ncbi:unnamed protein product, partial [Owenia fusiformis]